MHAKYEVSISYGSKVIAKVKVDNRQSDRQTNKQTNIQTNRQIGQKQYAPDHSIRGHKNTKELMHCHCGTPIRAPRWTFTDPCKPEVRPGAREESASPAWLAAPGMNARDSTKVYIWRLDT